MTPPATLSPGENAREHADRPDLPAPSRCGSRPFALCLCLPVYSALAMGVIGLSRSAPGKAAPARSQAILLQEDDDYAPPPPPSPGRAGRREEPKAVPQEPPTEAPASLPTEKAEPPVPQVPPETGAGAPGGNAPGGVPGGTPGGVRGGLEGGIPGGRAGSVQLPPRFDAAYLQNPSPDYPGPSKRLGEEGRVVLRVLVTPEGRAQSLEIRTSSGFARLDQAALETVRRWRFIPARQGVAPIAAWVLVPITFQLDA